MQEFAEQYIEGLLPKEARYDTRLGDDFFICTFPNGVKTWIYVYTVDGFQRRRTLGVYPQMSLSDARDALFNARRLQQVEAELIEHGLAGEVVRHGGLSEERPAVKAVLTTPVRFRDRQMLVGALAGSILTLSGVLALAAFDRLSATSSSPAAVAGARAAPGKSPPVPSAASVPGSPAAAPDSADADPPQAADAAAGIEAARESAGHASAASGDPSQAEATRAYADPNPAALEVQEALRGTVSREVLTRQVSDDQPAEELGSPVVLDGQVATPVFYFTEVRGMQGKQLRHRWVHEGRVVAEVPLRVGRGWRWPLYSSTRVEPQMTGRWKVLLLDAEGAVIESADFVAERRDPPEAAKQARLDRLRAIRAGDLPASR